MEKYLPVWIPSKKNKVESKSISISSLAPKILTKKVDIEKIQPYLDKLKDTIDTKGINNIALTGGYGSGKSTIIKTFKNLHKEYDYLNISLAAFNKTRDENIELENIDSNTANENKSSNDSNSRVASKSQKEELERLLEVSILQQIFYHVKPSDIPESRFKRIINIPSWKIWLISFGFIIWILSSILSIKYNYLDKINPKNWSSKDDFDLFAIIIFLVTFAGVGLFSKFIVQVFSNSKINKVNIKGELELGDNINKSVFNEHLEEILYFFEKTPYNIVIIEDLDRFDSTDIFTKLREINILLNNSKLINKGGNREINFIYAIGDDLFENKNERVKFFEYIIPVIPFINSSNASEQLKTLIKEAGLEENIFSTEFISDVVTFINDIDMRLLTNIFHEFVIYRNTLKAEFVTKPEQLFAIITYKNLDPGDFVKLNKKEGKLYNLIDNKKQYIKDFIDNGNEKIKKLEKQIELIKNENINNLEDLRAIYIFNLAREIPQATEIYLNDTRHKFADLIDPDLFEQLLKITDFRYFQNGNGVYTSGVSFAVLENSIKSDFSYKPRTTIINDKNNNKVNLLFKEIENLKSNLSEIESWELKQIFREIDIDQYLNNFSNNLLLRNLILEGYINENYNDYISLFHEVSLTKEDFSFERNVKSAIKTDLSFELNHIENLINRIDVKYFDREYILNFNVIDFLGNNYERYSIKYDIIIKQLSNEKQVSIDFIDQYIQNQDRQVKIFIDKLTGKWKGFWDYIIANYSEEKQNNYLSLILRFAKIEDLLSTQNIEAFSTSITQKPYFLSVVKSTNDLNYLDKISDIISQLEIEFDKLDPPNQETKSLFDFVYNSNHYKINKENLFIMIKEYGRNGIDENFERSNYTSILESGCENLIHYINLNIDLYIENVYLKLANNKFEREDNLIQLLNNTELEYELKIEIIQNIEVLISDLNTINEVTVKEYLLINNKVSATWNNVINYYSEVENQIDDTLIAFFNFENVYKELSNNIIPKNQSFEESLLTCNEIPDEIYIKLLDSCYYRWNQLPFENLDEEKVNDLVNRRLNTTKDNYEILREYFPTEHITLLENDIDKFLNKSEDFIVDKDDVLMLITSSKIKDQDKLKLIPKIEEEIIIENKNVSKYISDLILKYKTKIDFNYDIVKSLFANSTSVENRIKLFNIYSDDLESSQIKNLINSMGGDYSRVFLNKKRPTFNNIDYHQTLFNKLKREKLIKNFAPDSKKPSLIRVTAND